MSYIKNLLGRASRADIDADIQFDGDAFALPALEHQPEPRTILSANVEYAEQILAEHVGMAERLREEIAERQEKLAHAVAVIEAYKLAHNHMAGVLSGVSAARLAS